MLDQIDNAAASAAGGGRPNGVTVRLKKPVPKDANSDVQDIYLRVPTFGDFVDIGPIQSFIGRDLDPQTQRPQAVENVMDRDALLKWIVRLSDLPANSILLLHPDDARNLTLGVMALVSIFTSQAGN
jgi:hypothetical protein